MAGSKMNDLRSASARPDDAQATDLLDLVPESIREEEDIVALTRAIAPEFQNIADAVVETVILPNIANLPEVVLDELAWSMRLNELQIWDDATVAGKRTLLANIFAIRKKAGTRYAVRRIFDLLSVVGRVIEWWEEGAAANTYRLRLDATDVGMTLAALRQIPELLDRFARVSQGLTEIGVEVDSPGTLYMYPALTVGDHVTIRYGAP
jgi:phage tail P2-like protein